MVANKIHTDDELLTRIAQGDAKAMQQLFDLYYNRLYYFALKLLKEVTEAEDTAQEALTAFWQKRESFRGAPLKDAEAFLFTVVRNRCYNYSKHRQMKIGKEGAILSELPLTEDYLEAQIIREDVFYRIYQEIQLLPEPQVNLLKMIYLEGMETDEIAARLQITPNNVRNQKARTLEKLRTILVAKGLFTSLELFILFFH